MVKWIAFTLKVKRWGNDPPFLVGGILFNRDPGKRAEQYVHRIVEDKFGQEITPGPVTFWPDVDTIDEALDLAVAGDGGE